MSRGAYLALCVFMSALLACSKGPGEPLQKAEQPPSGGEKQSAPAETDSTPAPYYAFVPPHTRIAVRLNEALSTGKNKAGDTFTASLDESVVVDGKDIVPRGSPVTGKVVSAKASGRVKGLARIALTLTRIQIRGVDYPIHTAKLSFKARPTKKQDALKIGGGAGIGAAIGALAGGGKGAAIGAAVGGGAGTATVLATRGKEVGLAPEQKLHFELTRDLQVRFN